VDDEGLAFLDLAAGTPRVVWRELGPATRVVDIARSPDGLAAVVVERDPRGRPVTSVWRWTLPDLVLRARAPFAAPDAGHGALAADGALLLVRRSAAGPALELVTEWRNETRAVAVEVPGVAAADVTAVRGAGALLFAVHRRPAAAATPGTVVEQVWPKGGPAVRVTLPGAGDAASVATRVHGGRLTVSDGLGRVVVADLRSRRVLANLTVRF
jgi:hypothetical protein